MSAQRHKFLALDGMRGLAALAVALFHRRSWFGNENFLGHAYLAVDFFFLLSGFVIAHAYEARLRERGALPGFLRDRIIRLHPMLLLAGIVAAVALVLQVRTGHLERPAHMPAALIAGVLPLPAIWLGQPFPANLPLWSLFWEIVANILFALAVPYLTTRRLAALVAMAGAIMLVADSRIGSFDVGAFSDTLPLGLPRVCFSFFLGALLLRVHRSGRLRLRVPGWLPPLLLFASFLLPRLSPWSIVYDPAVVLLLYPALLLWGAASTPTFPTLAKWSGLLSYPLYLLHDPVLKLLTAILVTLHVQRESAYWPAIGALHFPALILIAYLVLRLYDEPVRAWLRARFGSRGHRAMPVQPS